MKPRAPMWKIIIGIGISLVFLILALHNIHWEALGQAVARIQPLWLIPGAAFILLSYLLRSVLWKILLGPQNPTRIWNLFRIMTLGYFANNILPLKLGEVIRAWLLSKKEGLSASLAIGTVVVERVMDLFALLFYFTLMMLIQPFPHWLKISGALIAGLGVVLIIVIVVNYYFGGHLLNALEKPLSRLPGGAGPWVHQQIGKFLHGLRLIQSPGQVLMVFGLALGAWLSWMLVTYACFMALGLTLPFVAAIFLMVVLNFGLMIPSSPGGMGVFEYMVILALAPYGVAKEAALSLGLVFHLLQFFLTLGLGWLFAMQFNLSMNRVADQSTELETPGT